MSMLSHKRRRSRTQTSTRTASLCVKYGTVCVWQTCQQHGPYFFLFL